HDAFRRVEVEVRVALVLYRVEVVLTLVAVPDLTQADCACHVLQFAVAIGTTGEAVERVVGDVELHDVLTEFGDLRRLRPHDHAVGHRGRARGRRAPAAVDLDQAQSAGAERIQPIRGAQLGDVDPGERGRAHDRSAFRD